MLVQKEKDLLLKLLSGSDGVTAPEGYDKIRRLRCNAKSTTKDVSNFLSRHGEQDVLDSGRLYQRGSGRGRSIVWKRKELKVVGEKKGKRPLKAKIISFSRDTDTILTFTQASLPRGDR